MKRLPILVTYRSAEDFRDAGMRFANRKAGVYVGLTAAMFCGAAAMRLLSSGVDDGLMITLFAIAIGALAMALYSVKGLEFPQFPRLSLKEIETMRSDMGLPSDVFKRTHDNVLHGTLDELRAIQKTDTLLASLRKNVGPTQGK